MSTAAPAAVFSPRPYEIWSASGQFALSLDADPILGELEFRAQAAEAQSDASAFIRPCGPEAQAGSADALLQTPLGRLAFLGLPPEVVAQWRESGLLVVEFDDQGPLREHYFSGPPAELAAGAAQG